MNLIIARVILDKTVYFDQSVLQVFYFKIYWGKIFTNPVLGVECKYSSYVAVAYPKDYYCCRKCLWPDAFEVECSARFSAR